MPGKLSFSPCSNQTLSPRIGGDACIGGVVEWAAPDGNALVLAISLPAQFLNDHTELAISPDAIVSVFTCYSPDDYFLDNITYHGAPEELAVLRQGFTQVFIHPCGKPVSGSSVVPAQEIVVTECPEDELNYCDGSKIGGNIKLLQNETLDTGNLNFSMQLYGGDFPDGFKDIFYLADAVGYLFLPKNNEKPVDACGLFFVQAT